MKHYILKSFGSAALFITLFIPFLTLTTSNGSQVVVTYHFPYEYFAVTPINIAACMYLLVMVAYILCLFLIRDRAAFLGTTIALLTIDLAMVVAACWLCSYGTLQCIFAYVGTFLIYVFNYAVLSLQYVDLPKPNKQ
ncbi:MAG: hypothetical protein J5755_01975 [Clostridia bacterium]|nr:hypothetical protein [Clostridia bacterium]